MSGNAGPSAPAAPAADSPTAIPAAAPPRRRHGWVVAALLGIALLAVALAAARFLRPESAARLQQLGIVLMPEARIVPLPHGLVDQHGAPFDAGRLRGGWTLAFFGFTHCPDVCPLTVAEMGRLGAALESRRWGEDLRLLFISIDPARDTPQRLAAFLRRAARVDMMALTGEPAALRGLAAGLGVPVQRAADGGETFNHGANVFIISPDGLLRAYLKPPVEAARLERAYRAVRRHFDDGELG